MSIQPYDELDLGGGLNEGQPWASLNENEMTVLKNWYPFGRKLRRRGGVRLITTSGAWDENIYSMFPLKTASDEWIMLCGGETKIGKLDGDTISDIASTDTLGSGGTDLWRWFQYKNYVYAMRPSAGKMIRIEETSWQDAGIAAPTVAPTIAEGAAGDLTAADYYCVYTFYNSATGMESNPSPVSSALTLAADKEIDWSDIQASLNPFVDSRRLYRTLPDQVGEYFYVGTIPNNVDTIYADEDVIIADMGRAVSYDNGVPPADLETGVMWRERHFATDGVDLYYSEYSLPECFGDDSYLPVYPDDGHEIRALHAFGDRLIIGKTNKIHYLVGADEGSFAVLTLSDKHGCYSHHSMHSAEGMLFWYGSGNNVYRSDGNNVVEISTVKVRDTLDQIPDDLADQVVGAVFPGLSWYLISCPQTGYTNNRVVLVYNYKTDAWTTFTHPSDAPQFLADYFDENLEHILYSTFYDGNIYQYADESYGLDFGNTISAELITRAMDFGQPALRKYIKEAWVLIPRVSGGTITLEVYNDEDTSASISRSPTIDILDSAWKAYRIPTGTPASQLRFGMKYANSTIVDLEGFHFQVGQLTRRPKQPI
jgi:hypothetical protein